MKLIVKSEFRDIRNFDLIHKVGEVIDVEDSRGLVLVGLCLCEDAGKKEEKDDEDVKVVEDETLSIKRGRRKTNDDKPVS